ncbi:MAG: hypothetical protein PQJ58_06725 [Spirochaetales bacterium]|nr:hypothetical protein [Spirochaetales bacterium]
MQMSKYKYINKVVELVEQLEWLDPREIIGCSEQEIDALDDLFDEGFFLPDSYGEFLKYCGHGFGNILQRESFFYNDIYALNKKNYIRKLYQDKGFFHPDFKEQFLDYMFLCYKHQDYFIRGFDLLDFEDPQVSYYEAGMLNRAFVLQDQSFSEYFSAEISQNVALIESSFKKLVKPLQKLFLIQKCAILNILDSLEESQSSESVIPRLKYKCMTVIDNLYSVPDYIILDFNEWDFHVICPPDSIHGLGCSSEKQDALIRSMTLAKESGTELYKCIQTLKK